MPAMTFRNIGRSKKKKQPESEWKRREREREREGVDPIERTDIQACRPTTNRTGTERLTERERQRQRQREKQTE